MSKIILWFKSFVEPNYSGHPDDWSDKQWAHYRAWKKRKARSDS